MKKAEPSLALLFFSAFICVNLFPNPICEICVTCRGDLSGEVLTKTEARQREDGSADFFMGHRSAQIFTDLFLFIRVHLR